MSFRLDGRWISASRGGATPTVCWFSIAAALALTGCGRDNAGGPPQRPPAVVTVAVAESQDVPVYLDEIGRCSASEYVNILPQISGKVTEIHFNDGAEVKKGQPLFKIDARPFQADQAKAEANLARDNANLAFALAEFDRVQTLIKTNAVSRQEFDTKENAVAVTSADIKATRSAVDAAKLNIEYCEIVSPIDGRVGRRMVDPGNVVKINETSMVVIQRLDPVYADFTVAERNLPLVRRHMSQGALKALVSTPGELEQPRGGELTFLDTAVQQGAGSVFLRATLPNADRHFWPGQFVDVRLVLQVQPDAVLIPAPAVQISQKGNYVYVVQADDTAELRPVTLGQRQGERVVIDKGLATGERVITAGQAAVAPGAKVTVAPAAPPVAATPTSHSTSAPPNTAPASLPSTRPATAPATTSAAVLPAAPSTLPATAKASDGAGQGAREGSGE